MDHLSAEDQAKIDAIRKKVKSDAESGTNDKTNICPKCKHFEEKEFTVCPACELVIEKYYKPSVLASKQEKRLKNKQAKSFDEENSSSKFSFRPLLILSFVVTLLLAVFIGTKGNISLSGLTLLMIPAFFLLFLTFYVISFCYRVILGKDTLVTAESTQSTTNNNPGANLLVVASLIIIGLYFIDFDRSPDFEVTAKQLYNEFEENELAAHAKYKGKTVIVSGRYASSGVSLGRPYILIDVGSSFFTVQCFFDSNDAKEAAHLTKGTNIKLKGIVAGQTLNVFLEGCSVVN